MTARRLLQQVSFEITPNMVKSMPRCGFANTKVFVTSLASSDSQHQGVVHACAQLAELGYVPIPHVTARSFRDSAHLVDTLTQMRDISHDGRRVVDEVLLLAGDHRPEDPSPFFRDSQAVLESGLLWEQGIQRVGFAGHPEGIPGVAASVLYESLLSKAKLAKENGCGAYIVTNFCFDAQTVFKYMDALRLAGSDLPVRAGVAGPTKLSKLLKYSQFAGVGASISFLKKHKSAMMPLFSYKSDDVVRDLVQGQPNYPELEGIHVFTFNNWDGAETWVDDWQLAEGVER